MNNRTRTAIALASFLALATGMAAFGQGSPWLPVPQTVTFGVSVVEQEATTFYRGEDEIELPFGKFTQDTTWFDVSYGLGDKTAIDFRTGNSEVDTRGAGAMNVDSRVDTTIGLTRSLRDELETQDYSSALRVALTLAGDYEVGGTAGPTAPGDGGDAVTVEYHVGKFVNERLAIAGDAGIRLANNDVPTEINFGFGAHVVAAPNVGLYAQFQRQQSMGDLDIGTPDFKGRFAEVQENVSRLRFGGSVQLGNLAVDVSTYQILGGRNTAVFDILNLSFSLTFDTYQP